MKKIIGIFLLFSLMAPALSTWIWFDYHQKSIKKEVKHLLISQLSDDELELLIFSENELKTALEWEHEKEFKFKGVMYDIVRRKKVEGKYYFWCWKDSKETKLNQKFEQLLAIACGNDSNQHKKQQQLFQFFNSLFLIEHYSWETPTTNTLYATQMFKYCCLYQSIHLEQQSPPPNFI